MRVVIIGGTGFIGRYVSEQLVARGDEVTNFHRGQTPSDRSPEIWELIGERSELETFRAQFEDVRPEVVIDMIAMSEGDAQSLLRTFKGITQRLVVVSSADVYRNYELVRGVAEEAQDPTPLTENSPLRANLFPYRAQAKSESDPLYNYDKILVERTVMNDHDLPSIVLRLPAVYGPGDQKHRLFHHLKRMDDERPAILLERGMMDWRWTRGYVENVAAAISWAAGDQTSTSCIYNVGESKALPEREWIASIAHEVGWNGKVIGVDPAQLPDRMRSGLCWKHQLETDTSLIRSQKQFSEPVSFIQGIRRTIAWERANPPSAVKAEDFDYESEDRVLESLRA